MNSPALFQVWLQVLGLLAVEVGLAAGLMALGGRWRGSTTWRRTWCQAAIVTVLVLTLAELSGAARAVGARARHWLAGSPAAAPAEAVAPATPRLTASFRARVEARLAAHQASTAVPPTGASPAHGEPPAATVSAPDKERLAQPVLVEPQPLGSADALAVLGLGLVWLVGTALVIGRTGLAHSLLFWFRWRRRPVTDRGLAERVSRLGQALGLRRRVRLVASARLTGPVVFGLFRPTIGLPPDFQTRFDRVRQEAILAHELAHLAARDPLWSLVADLAAALLWWHPAVWWVRRELQMVSELAADEASLLVEDGPQVLAECLVEMGARLLNPPVLGQMNVGGFRSALGRRVHQLAQLEHRVWSPPARARAAVWTGFGAAALAAVAVLCTAWATPQALTKGDTMKTMQLNWKRSLATVALLAAVQSVPAGAATPEAARPGGAAVPAETPARAVPASPAVVTPPAASVPAEAAPPIATVPRVQPRSRALPGMGAAPTLKAAVGQSSEAVAAKTQRQEQIEAKLSAIRLSEVAFDNLPLSEVVKVLSEQCQRRDPDKEGVNFLINPTMPLPAVRLPGGPIDSNTGLPVPGNAPQEQIDVGSIPVRFNLPLRNVTVRDVLNAMVLVVVPSLTYRMEDYGVVLELKGEGPQPSDSMGEQLVVRTFKVDTNTFVAGLESAFGIQRNWAQSQEQKAHNSQLQSALRELLTQLGVSLTPAKSVFYNELTGVLMVRGTNADQELVGAAVETLGGSLITSWSPEKDGPGRGRFANGGGRY